MATLQATSISGNLTVSGSGSTINVSGGTLTTSTAQKESIVSGATGTGILAPPGMILAFGMAGAPTGWLLCHGSAVSRSTYSALFSAIGTTWGSGDGSSTFNVPDFRGWFLRGYDAGVGRDPDRNSRSNGGDAVGSYQSHQYQSHSHSVAMYQHGFYGNVPFAGQDTHKAWQGTTATGGNETRPVNRAVQFMIKY